jgi:hypothetical protein
LTHKRHRAGAQHLRDKYASRWRDYCVRRSNLVRCTGSARHPATSCLGASPAPAVPALHRTPVSEKPAQVLPFDGDLIWKRRVKLQQNFGKR